MLDPGKKLRLCAYVSKEISWRSGFRDIAVESCGKKEFSVRNEVHYEWMLTCKIEDEEATHYRHVIRSYSDNEVFVLKADEDRKIILDYNMIHVSVIVDPASKL